MSLPAPKNNIADPKTGTVTPEWLNWLQELADGSGTASSTAGVVTEVASARTGGGTTVVSDGGGGSGGGLTIFNNYGTGTPNALTKWVATQVLGDSIMTESTTAVTVAGHVFATAFHGTLPSHGTTHAPGGADPIPPVTISAASRLVGRGSSGAGVAQEITLGTGLTMTGTVLDAPASSTVGPHAATHIAGGSDPVTITEAQVTNLTTDLAAKAPLASPALTGTPTAPTPITSDNSTKIATTAFVKALSNTGDEVFIGPSDPGTGAGYELWFDTDDPGGGAPGVEQITVPSVGGTIALSAGYSVHLLYTNSTSAAAVTWTGLINNGDRVVVFGRGAGPVTIAHNPGANIFNIATALPTPIALGGVAHYVAVNGAWVLAAHEQGAWIPWTPTLAGSGMTYGFQQGLYLLRGRSITITGYLSLTGKGAAAGAITSLPWTTGPVPAYHPCAFAQVNALATPFVFVTGYVPAGTASISLVGRPQGSPSTFAVIVNADLGNGTDFMFQMTYPVV